MSSQRTVRNATPAVRDSCCRADEHVVIYDVEPVTSALIECPAIRILPVTPLQDLSETGRRALYVARPPVNLL
jgi:hypothetical protein